MWSHVSEKEDPRRTLHHLQGVYSPPSAPRTAPHRHLAAQEFCARLPTAVECLKVAGCCQQAAVRSFRNQNQDRFRGCGEQGCVSFHVPEGVVKGQKGLHVEVHNVGLGLEEVMTTSRIITACGRPVAVEPMVDGPVGLLARGRASPA